ncbi:MAG: asparagine--tRNA ligase, partial [Gemmatimonadetes bacterium]|nr:asparagine--tRNA ligase [Gemmatimonadota bacterium]
MDDVLRIKDLPDRIGETVTLRAWVEKTRSSGKIAFVVLRDGTGYLQCVVPKGEVDATVWEGVKTLAKETSVQVTGEVRADARSPGGVELGMRELEVIGESVDFPITPKEHGKTF